MKQVGGSFYDKPAPGDTKTVWEQHLDSRKSIGSGAGTGGGAVPAGAGSRNEVDSAELKRMMSAERVEAAMKQAKSDGDKVDFNKFMDALRKA